MNHWDETNRLLLSTTQWVDHRAVMDPALSRFLSRSLCLISLVAQCINTVFKPCNSNHAFGKLNVGSLIGVRQCHCHNGDRPFSTRPISNVNTIHRIPKSRLMNMIIITNISVVITNCNHQFTRFEWISEEARSLIRSEEENKEFSCEFGELNSVNSLKVGLFFRFPLSSLHFSGFCLILFEVLFDFMEFL